MQRAVRACIEQILLFGAEAWYLADVPRNLHGNTIDLAFSNIALVSAVVEDHLATSSDHLALGMHFDSIPPMPDYLIWYDRAMAQRE